MLRNMLMSTLLTITRLSYPKPIKVEFLSIGQSSNLKTFLTGKRLPEWLIKELLESDRLHEKEELMRGKEVTKGEEIVKHGETVEQFIARKGIK